MNLTPIGRNNELTSFIRHTRENPKQTILIGGLALSILTTSILLLAAGISPTLIVIPLLSFILFLIALLAGIHLFFSLVHKRRDVIRIKIQTYAGHNVKCGLVNKLGHMLKIHVGDHENNSEATGAPKKEAVGAFDTRNL